MKKHILTFTLVLFSMSSFAQFGSIHNRVKHKVERHYEKKGEAIEKEHEDRLKAEYTEKGMKEAEKGVNKLEAWEDPYLGQVEMFVDNNLIENSDVQWQKLMFIKGENLIFFDKPFNFEEKKKKPTNWYIDEKSSGDVSIDYLDQGKSLLIGGEGYISPKFDGADKDYLPDNFTVEFDFMMPVTPFSKPMSINFYGINNSNKSFAPITINKNIVSYKDSTSRYPVMALDDNGMSNWYRISISYNKGFIEVYMNERKMITYKDNINPNGITISYFAYTPIFINDFIIAKNPKPILDQLNEGGYTSYNIDYLMNNDKLSGVSISELTKIAAILIKNPDMKMNIDVYFSQSKKDKENKEYGALKTETIKKVLVSMGAEESQLTTNFKGSIISSKINPKNRLSEAVIFTKL